MGYLKNRTPIILLFILILFVVMLNIWWVTMNTGEIYRTEQPKFVTVRSYLDSTFSYKECSYYPPAYFWMCAKTVSLLNIPLSYDHCVFVNLLYLVFALIGMFLLGKYLTSSHWYGLVAASLLPGLPIYLYVSRKFIGEFSITTCVILAMYFLISNCHWRHKGRSLLFGLVCGIGMLFKWSFIVYIIAPLLISIGYGFFDRRQSSKKDLFYHLFLSLLAAFVVCGYWYVVHFNITQFRYEFSTNLADGEHITSSYMLFLRHNFLLSLRTLASGGSMIFCLLFILAALIIGSKKLWKRADYVMILSWFAFPYIFFTCFVGDITPRYLLPILPALVLIVALTFFSNDRKKTLFWLLILFSFSLGSICYESFINRPPQEFSQVKTYIVLQYIVNKEKNPHIVFNGINDEVTECEVLDMFNLFYVNDIKYGLGMDLVYIKTKKDLKKNIQAQFILSQDISENNFLHEYFKKNGHSLSNRFSHHFHEDTDPLNDWSSHGDYLLFEREE